MFLLYLSRKCSYLSLYLLFHLRISLIRHPYLYLTLQFVFVAPQLNACRLNTVHLRNQQLFTISVNSSSPFSVSQAPWSSSFDLKHFSLTSLQNGSTSSFKDSGESVLFHIQYRFLDVMLSMSFPVVLSKVNFSSQEGLSQGKSLYPEWQAFHMPFSLNRNILSSGNFSALKDHTSARLKWNKTKTQ